MQPTHPSFALAKNQTLSPSLRAFTILLNQNSTTENSSVEHHHTNVLVLTVGIAATLAFAALMIYGGYRLLHPPVKKETNSAPSLDKPKDPYLIANAIDYFICQLGCAKPETYVACCESMGNVVNFFSCHAQEKGRDSSELTNAVKNNETLDTSNNPMGLIMDSGSEGFNTPPGHHLKENLLLSEEEKSNDRASCWNCRIC